MAALATPRMAAFNPGQSPPDVRIPIDLVRELIGPEGTQKELRLPALRLFIRETNAHNARLDLRSDNTPDRGDVPPGQSTALPNQPTSRTLPSGAAAAQLARRSALVPRLQLDQAARAAPRAGSVVTPMHQSGFRVAAWKNTDRNALRPTSVRGHAGAPEEPRMGSGYTPPLPDGGSALGPCCCDSWYKTQWSAPCVPC